MAITSLPFAAAVLALLGLYYLLPRRPQLWLLLAASYAFYATWAWEFPLGLLALTVVNYLIGRRLHRGGAKAWLWGGIALNIGALVLLKSAGFFLPQVIATLGLSPGDAPAMAAQVLLPVGFSYRVLENISFLVDVSRRQIGPFPRLDHFALYGAWFPKLLSGPIERSKAFLAQLPQGRVVDNRALASGLTLILVGLVRKLVLADLLRGLIPPDLFTNPRDHLGLQLAVPMLAAVFVVYNDFAGYTDIVRGISALFGIELTRNFQAPFFSRNFGELWLRWHSSLSLWLRDYLYLPLSRALLRRDWPANSLPNLVLPPLLAMLASALWHQVAWNLLAWGALWAAFLVLGRLPALRGPVVPPDRRPRWRQGLGMAGVALLLGVSNLVFQADLARAVDFLAVLLYKPFISAKFFSMAALMLISLGVDFFQHRAGEETVFLRWPAWARAAALATALLALFLATRLTIPEPFIYQNF